MKNNKKDAAKVITVLAVISISIIYFSLSGEMSINEICCNELAPRDAFLIKVLRMLGFIIPLIILVKGIVRLIIRVKNTEEKVSKKDVLSLLKNIGLSLLTFIVILFVTVFVTMMAESKADDARSGREYNCWWSCD